MAKTNEIMVSIPLSDLNRMQSQIAEQKQVKKGKSDKKLLTVKEALELLQVSRQTLYNWRKADLIPSHRINNRLYFFEDELLNAVCN